MNKEQIVKNKFSAIAYNQEDIEFCMQEYADQETIAFADWVALQYQYYCPTLWIDYAKGEEIVTTGQLLQKYKEGCLEK